MITNSSVPRIALEYGSALGALLVLYGLVYRVAHLDAVPGLGWIFYLALPAGAWLAQRALQKSGGGSTYRRALALGLLVAAIASPIYGIEVWGYNRFVDDSLLVELRSSQTESWQEKGWEGEKLERAEALLDVQLQPAVFASLIVVQLLAFALLTCPLIALLGRRDASLH